jgi:hypothetical protein
VLNEREWAVLDAATLGIRFRSDRPMESSTFKFLGDGKLVTLDKVPAGAKPTGEKEFRHELSIWDVAAGNLVTRSVVSTPTHKYTQLIAEAGWHWAGVHRMTSGDKENELLVFDAADWRAAPRTIPLHNAQAYVNAVDPAGRVVAFHIGNIVAVFDTATWERTHAIRAGKSSTWVSLDAPNARRLIVSHSPHNQMSVSVWDLTGGEHVFGFQDRMGFGVLEAGKLRFSTFDETDPSIPLLDGTPVPLDVARERLGIK